MKGQVISGRFGEIQIRQKSDSMIELGELLVAESEGGEIIMQVYDLIYGSQISQQNLELISGLQLEENTELDFVDPKLRNYTLALLKNIITLEKGGAKICKKLPSIFSPVREITKEDLKFLTKPENPLYFGNLRSGSKVLDVEISLDGKKVFPHHILIAATTGRGKSNLTSCMLWDSIGRDYCGILVLDPHDEYYGRNGFGLKDNPSKKLAYYTPKNAPPGCKTLKINLRDIRPGHFNGAVNWSDAQKEALNAYYKEYRNEWIEAIALEKNDKEIKGFQEGTLGVVRRRMLSLLNLSVKDNELFCSGIFDTQSGESTISDIVSELEQSNVVIVDTSSFSGAVEILIGSLVTTEIFNRYKSYKIDGSLDEKPVISVILEEAPRVLGKEVLENGPNIFSTIAREGRKFRIGLTAITQLPSLIPRNILANMNTKIILGIEMKPERQAIIESASQDLSTDDRNIASLDIGEAIITSNFARFATPIRIPRFKEFAQKTSKMAVNKEFAGISVY